MKYELFLPSKPHMENESFVLYASDTLKDFGEDAMKYILHHRDSILDFFGLENFRRVQINLYDDKELYKNFTKQYFDPTSYSTGNFAGGMINLFISEEKLLDKPLYELQKKNIVHEFVHVIYKEIIREKDSGVVWLEEGIAQTLSREKESLLDDQKLKDWFLRNIVRRDKIIPNIRFLKTHGSRYGTFCDIETNRYNGYALSYLMVRFLMDTFSKEKLQQIIRNKLLVEELEKTILPETISYYTDKFNVKTNFNDIENEIELLDYMNKNILYGWKDETGEIYLDTMKDFKTLYRTSSVQETIKNRVGTCIEQTRMEKAFFDRMGIPCKMFCLRSYGIEEQKSENVRMHCFILFEKNGKVYHFEHSNPLIPGIYAYDKEEEALENITAYYQNRDNGKTRKLSEFHEVPEGLSFQEFNEYLDGLNIRKKRVL